MDGCSSFLVHVVKEDNNLKMFTKMISINSKNK